MFPDYPVSIPNTMDNGKERKSMKRFIAMILTLMLIASLATTALAAYNGTMYVNAKKVNVYKEDNKDSKVLTTYKGGQVSVCR